MASVSSFRDVIANMYYNELFDELSEYIEDNPDKLESNSYRVQSPDEAALSDFDIITLDITDSPGNSILFDVIVSAEVEIAETVRRNRETDGIEQWFRISCRADLDDGIQNFQIKSVSIYNKYRESKLGRLSEYLVPIIEKEQFDNVATEFLNEFCPEALSTPMPIPVDEVVKRMGLKVEEIQLTKHFTIFGQIVFGDCTIEYYDRNERTYKPLEVSRGTILVDPNVYFMRNVGCMNNTIIHECVHWYKHRKYHELVKTYNSDALLISCRVNETTKYKQQWTPEDWMEWHANGIAPRILMPRSMTIKKIEELIKKNELLFGTYDRLNIMENVVYELADFFQVSRIAAKIRMLDLGYKEVEGVYTYVDDHFISNYSFKADSLHKNQTYSISLSDSFFEYYANPEFAKIIDSGNFIYVDGHYIINDSKYIKRLENGSIDLTDYAKLHVDECCLLFDLKLNKASKMDIVVYLDSIMFRKATPDYNRVPTFNPDKHNMEVFNRSEELKKFHEEFVEEGQHLSRTTQTFSQAVYGHIKRKGYNKVVFIEKTLLSGKHMTE
ncbi:ImmA/IrrE family metallo-endopeptidase [Acetivibrio straminisolvens]|uniref:IrrE N-terminal-like domain-containing protein n=1 Tax=Acetivibrio straminisolvens JCM 21531 TaxID=1294263 RepID=W4V9F5_9FIRM|nr:hypothetical protein [Acetivibrio straminisolvens]GAE89379.1 hypothetical protein JCM21531_2898 [Acetivibrio straminisolvens JCM 21531]